MHPVKEIKNVAGEIFTRESSLNKEGREIFPMKRGNKEEKGVETTVSLLTGRCSEGRMD